MKVLIISKYTFKSSYFYLRHVSYMTLFFTLDILVMILFFTLRHFSYMTLFLTLDMLVL